MKERFFGIKRDMSRAAIAGVCAGIAKRFNFDISTVRLVVLISVVFSFFTTFFIYFILANILPKDYSGMDDFFFDFSKKNKIDDDYIDVNGREL